MTQLNAQALMAMPYEQMVACIKSWNRHKMEESRSWRFWRRNDQFEPQGDWRYLAAHDGMRLWNRSNGRDSIYTGGVWRSGPIIANPSGGAVVDTEARATIGAMLQYFRLIGMLTP
jgi:hypothetical protein